MAQSPSSLILVSSVIQLPVRRVWDCAQKPVLAHHLVGDLRHLIAVELQDNAVRGEVRVHPLQRKTDLDEKVALRVFVEQQLGQLGVDLHYRHLSGHGNPIADAVDDLARLERPGFLTGIGRLLILRKCDLGLHLGG